MLAAMASAALSRAAPPGAVRLMPSACAAALRRIASAALADRPADAAADADALADADAEVAIEAPMPGVARLKPVRLLSDDKAEVSFSSAAKAAATGPSSGDSRAPSPGIPTFIDRAATFRLAAALAPKGAR